MTSSAIERAVSILRIMRHTHWPWLHALAWVSRGQSIYIVFQALPHMLEVGQEIWHVLAKCHDRRNVAEYEGYLEMMSSFYRIY